MYGSQPIKKKKTRKKSLESHEVHDALDQKNHTTTIITEFLMITEKNLANSLTLINNYDITHIINTNPKRINNYFDRAIFEKNLSVYTTEEREEILSTNLLGKIRYFNVVNWTEHTVNLNMALCDELFTFIKGAV